MNKIIIVFCLLFFIQANPVKVFGQLRYLKCSNEKSHIYLNTDDTTFIDIRIVNNVLQKYGYGKFSFEYDSIFNKKCIVLNYQIFPTPVLHADPIAVNIYDQMMKDRILPKYKCDSSKEIELNKLEHFDPQIMIDYIIWLAENKDQNLPVFNFAIEFFEKGLKH